MVVEPTVCCAGQLTTCFSFLMWDSRHHPRKSMSATDTKARVLTLGGHKQPACCPKHVLRLWILCNSSIYPCLWMPLCLTLLSFGLGFALVRLVHVYKIKRPWAHNSVRTETIWSSLKEPWRLSVHFWNSCYEWCLRLDLVVVGAFNETAIKISRNYNFLAKS